MKADKIIPFKGKTHEQYNINVLTQEQINNVKYTDSSFDAPLTAEQVFAVKEAYEINVMAFKAFDQALYIEDCIDPKMFFKGQKGGFSPTPIFIAIASKDAKRELSTCG